MSFVIFGTESYRYELLGSVAYFLLSFWNNFLALVHAEVKYSTLGTLLTTLTNSKETVGWRKRYEVNALCAFRSRNEELSVFLNVVNNHVMTRDVY